jgi:hypothetical protein
VSVNVDGDLHGIFRTDVGDGMEGDHRLHFLGRQGADVVAIMLGIGREIRHLQVEEVLPLLAADIVSVFTAKPAQGYP